MRHVPLHCTGIYDKRADWTEIKLRVLIIIMDGSLASSLNIKAVLFDVGGVLFSPPQAAIAEVERDLGLPR